MTRRPEVALLRVAAQGLAGPGAAAPREAARALLALQAQDLRGGLLSVALRTAGGDRAGVVAALDAGELVRSWPLRGTLHLVAADDLRLLLAVTGDRTLARGARRRAELGLDDIDVARAREIAVTALDGGTRLTRRALLAAWHRAGLDTDGQRGYHLLVAAAQAGAVCLGPVAGAEQQVVAVPGSIAGSPDPAEREQALGELTRRYLAGHGPASARDLARWADLPAADVRAGLALARDRLERLELDGVELWLDPGTPGTLRAARHRAAGVHLLPGFDELLLGYADRTPTLAAEHASRVVPGGNGVFRPTVLHRGRVVGTWRRGGVAAAEPEVTAFAPLPASVAAAVRRRYAALPR